MLYSGIAYCAILMMLVKVIKIFNSAAVGGRLGGDLPPVLISWCFPPVCRVAACSHCGRVAHQAPAVRTHALGNQLGKDQTVWRLTCTAAFTKMGGWDKTPARNAPSL